MSTVRKIDYDEAQRRYAEGDSIASIARRFGVTPTAIRRVVIAGFKERMVESSRKHSRMIRLRGWPCPRCGERKSQKAKLCRECSNEDRLRELETSVPVVGSLDYFSSGRYGLIAVSGMGGDREEFGTSFSIVDTLDMCRELSRIRVGASRVPVKHAQLVAKVKDMNRGALSRRRA